MLGRRHTLEVARNAEALELASLADVGWRCGVNRGASAGSIVDRRADVPQKLSTEMESTNGKQLRWREMGKTEEWAGVGRAWLHQLVDSISLLDEWPRGWSSVDAGLKLWLRWGRDVRRVNNEGLRWGFDREKQRRWRGTWTGFVAGLRWFCWFRWLEGKRSINRWC
ncbi:hypothetical protein ACJRO7_031598 [Eucalyptus globulus]|uniref:Uncharacterized protein n=1 Tax=Eucalyptus globulus TaxID=34317 RepID=A0ABD3JKP9_EUCGL